MKIHYKEPTVIDRIDQAIARALENQQAIDTIRLTAQELQEFCQAEGRAFGKEYFYHYKGFRVAYDWGE